MDCTEIFYLYRDAGNYKFRDSIIVGGIVSLDEIKAHLIEEEYFIPERIGVAPLVPMCMNGDDHPLHEIDCISYIVSDVYQMNRDEFLNRFRNASAEGWYVA